MEKIRYDKAAFLIAHDFLGQKSIICQNNALQATKIPESLIEAAYNLQDEHLAKHKQVE